jgi:tRNA1Val (adenine37-N6)-methyltransferase
MVMSQDFFQFKQFIVRQDQSAMKVCTEACIFGACIQIEKSTSTILDIGTGTGLLTLMMAQKTTEEVRIDAVEIEPNAAKQASENIYQSPWSQRSISVYPVALQDYRANTGKKYDLIVSNPPFYQNHLKSPNTKKNLALHNDSLPFDVLVSTVSILLSENGYFWILLPAFIHTQMTGLAEQHGLFLIREINIYNQANKEVFRKIGAFSKKKQELKSENLIIRNADNSYTGSFKSLLKDYYLHL